MSETVEKRFPVVGTPTLHVSTFDGSVEVEAWDRPEIVVTIEKIGADKATTDRMIVNAANRNFDAGFIARLEQGYDTVLGEGGARLAVGEKQLLAIARALAVRPRILLLDEATSHIDSETEQVVQRALAALHGQLTIISIAHRLSTIRDADRIVVLQQGRVAELGPHEALMARDGGIYRRLVELQQLAAEDDAPA